MKILYAIQATGNGHISRAIELLPYLQKYGNIDVFLSGNNASLPSELPVKYKSKGVSLFYSKKGKLNYQKTLKQINPSRIYRDVRMLPIQKYDLILNDFEYICSTACKLADVKMVHFGHQASFASKNTPRPSKKDALGEWVLKKYCKSEFNVGFHFDAYEPWILPPVIKQELWQTVPQKKEHITVYLPHYSDEILEKTFQKFKHSTFHIFSKNIPSIINEKNIVWHPIQSQLFNTSLLNCDGIITGAGFETPAESLFLGKKLMVLPIRGQYEQKCNAEAMKPFGVTVVKEIDDKFHQKFEKWRDENHSAVNTPNYLTTDILVEKAMQIALK
jgi:uncharacterized protein (TIGR00661 family)